MLLHISADFSSRFILDEPSVLLPRDTPQNVVPKYLNVPFRVVEYDAKLERERYRSSWRSIMIKVFTPSNTCVASVCLMDTRGQATTAPAIITLWPSYVLK